MLAKYNLIYVIWLQMTINVHASLLKMLKVAKWLWITMKAVDTLCTYVLWWWGRGVGVWWVVGGGVFLEGVSLQCIYSSNASV